MHFPLFFPTAISNCNLEGFSMAFPQNWKHFQIGFRYSDLPIIIIDTIVDVIIISGKKKS